MIRLPTAISYLSYTNGILFCENVALKFFPGKFQVFHLISNYTIPSGVKSV